ncbi:MAG: site-specific DNA-methyltransferase [Acidobacteriia bacterium]|nr:site-specific DNA-methyltransferase [Terriglobia bacterium]
MARTRSGSPPSKPAKSYKHPESESPMRPEVGTQSEFKKKLPPKKYRYDDSLSPVLEWDGQNPAREHGEARIATAEAELADARKELNGKPDTKEVAAHVSAAQKAVSELKAMSKPFLNWSGKAERLSFDVPTLPLFIHERLSTKAILETLKGHKRDKQADMFDLFGDPQHSITDQVLRAYEHKDKWVNRMILGDSLVVMNSLLHYEGLGGQVQMIYFDPPYGVKFGSNFQPFVRKRDVTHNDDEDMTREPEMVQAYRDTWELGVHTYLTYLRDRLILARDLLNSRGSIFVQIGDQNLHHVREVMDEVFGSKNFSAVISYSKTTSTTGDDLSVVNDYILWYFRDAERDPFVRMLYKAKKPGETGGTGYTKVLLPDGSIEPLSAYEEEGLPSGARICTTGDLTSSKPPGDFPVQFAGKTWRPTKGYWKTGEDGMQRLIAANRVYAGRKTLGYIRLLEDFPCFEVNNIWTDTVGQNQFGPGGKVYAVQTANIAVQRCMLMATQPGDLVLDPTCGSGTTAYVAEQWGRRWITIDTSRVPLALARQRLLTATFAWYQLRDTSRGPAGGFEYQRRQNKKGDEVGGIVPHVKLETIANSEQPQEEVLVDRPEQDGKITRVTGPFCVEATIPTPQDWVEVSTSPDLVGTADGSFVDRMVEILRKTPVLRLEGNRTVTLKSVRPPAKSLSLSAEAIVANGAEKAVAFVFGPENGAVSEKLVYEAAREARAKSYTHLYVVGFAIQPNARQLIEKCDSVVNIPATYVQATPDLMMSDLLKSTRSSQVFSVCGMPEVELRIMKVKEKDEPTRYEVELLGMDVFDPTTLEVHHRTGEDVPAWFLDSDYNALCFHTSQAFFPRTGAWENLKKALKGDYEETVWDHLAGTVSAPFEIGENGQIAVKVIDDRGNELLIVKSVSEAKS